jgi:endonuclease YncB( thermonuclease family)
VRNDGRVTVLDSAMPRILLLAVLLAGAFAVAPAAAHAGTGSCLVPGVAATCTIWDARVTYISDGDTFYADVAGEGRRHVRLTGVNATEQTVYSRFANRRRGECHSLEATARLEELIRKSKGRVRLLAQDPASHSGRRIRRTVAVKINGRWRDVGRRLLAEGHAVWLPNKVEHVWNRDYSVLAQRAAKLGRGIWNPEACGPGPVAQVRIWANWDADGHDDFYPEGEWIKVQNLDPAAPLALGGWWVRDSGIKRYTFPAHVSVPPLETVTVNVGRGADTWTELFWGNRRPIFGNVNANRASGDGAYLFDPDGDLRASMMYPCRFECSDPNAGLIQISAKSQGREHITLRNAAPHAIDLGAYRLSSPPYQYSFTRDAVLLPGEEMTIRIKGDPASDTRLEKHWGETGWILNARGDKVRLSSYTDIQIGCYSYGDAVC